MTERQHRLWKRVARWSKRGRWYRPQGTDTRILGRLFMRGYFQRRRADGAYRLAGLWPRSIWPNWARAEDRERPQPWWPPWIPFVDPTSEQA